MIQQYGVDTPWRFDRYASLLYYSIHCKQTKQLDCPAVWVSLTTKEEHITAPTYAAPPFPLYECV